jgi:hypothetical protein
MRTYKIRRYHTQKAEPEKEPVKLSPLPLEDRIRRYLAKIPAAVSGQNGHTQTFWVARALVHGFALSEEQALPFLREYNRRCEPPWNQEELKHKLKSASDWKPKRLKNSRGHLLE